MLGETGYLYLYGECCVYFNFFCSGVVQFYLGEEHLISLHPLVSAMTNKFLMSYVLICSEVIQYPVPGRNDPSLSHVLKGKNHYIQQFFFQVAAKHPEGHSIKSQSQLVPI